jgi:hypothetical protein
LLILNQKAETIETPIEERMELQEVLEDFFCKDLWFSIFKQSPIYLLLIFKRVNRLFRRLADAELQKRSLAIDSTISIARLLDFAYYDCSLQSVTYKDKTYYGRTTMWYTRPDVAPISNDDPNLPCKGYSSCDDDDEESEGGYKVYPEDYKLIRYNMALHIPNNSWAFALLSYLEHRFVYLPHSIILHNDMGLNDDHRGKDHFNIEVDFHDDWTIEKGVHSIQDIVQACYRIKGNKLNNQYEAFFRFIHNDFKEDELNEKLKNNISFDATDNVWDATPVIDHGS